MLQYNSILHRWHQSRWLLVSLVGIFMLQVVSQVTQSDLGLYIVQFLSLDSNPSAILHHPWSLLTYAFVHTSPYHFVLSLGILIYVHSISSMRLSSLLTYHFMVGALTGGLSFVLYSLVMGSSYSFLAGASAGVCGCISAVLLDTMGATGTRREHIAPHSLLPLLALPVWDMIQCITGHPDALPAHIGGYIGGIVLSLLIVHTDRVPNQPRTDEYHRQIIDKVRTSGYSSLSEEEREQLHDHDTHQSSSYAAEYPPHL